MPNMKRGYIGSQNTDPHYIDLEPWQDDKIVLKNPHKGWYWHYIDNGCGRATYRDNLAPGDDMKDFPGLNHLYLRFDWGDIEKQEGVYDWSYIDEIMDKWGNLGYRFSFRLCTYEAGNAPESIKYATPKWVFEAGANHKELPDGCVVPDYQDPIYLQKLENMMREYGRKFNNDPRVEFVDIGTFGTWGEGHLSFGKCQSCSDEVVLKHILLHTKYFPNKYVLLNDDMISGRSAELVEIAKTLGCGARDDSICWIGNCQTYGYNTLKSPLFFDQLSDNAPVDIEFEHYHVVVNNPPVWREGFPFIEALKRTKATYAGFHGYPRPWLERFPALTEYVANRLGYWFFIDGIRLTNLYSGCSNVIEIDFTNKGYAHCYNKFDFRLALVRKSDSKRYVFDIDAVDCRRWEPNTPARERCRIDLCGIEPDEYILECGLFENGDPIKFAMQQELLDEGWYKLTEISVI